MARPLRRWPWLGNVLLYGGLFGAGDAAQQQLRRRGREPGPGGRRRGRGLAADGAGGDGGAGLPRALQLRVAARAGAAPSGTRARRPADQGAGRSAGRRARGRLGFLHRFPTLASSQCT
ncbi:hypothetical protein JRQ81_010163 [Phrynocephalus forsythii]|uniref:Uncharacterized protein n=1 Tax=Phrynocephalus forsythii TaxID=171643 RepID=A0A9Q0XA19_9SAUR|nr:hypothetical protein JRQ81_010163 [Phrynocephalus forsythii]